MSVRKTEHTQKTTNKRTVFKASPQWNEHIMQSITRLSVPISESIAIKLTTPFPSQKEREKKEPGSGWSRGPRAIFRLSEGLVL